MIAGMESAYERLAIRLKELRLKHKVTQEEFAEIAGFSYKFYQQIESGRKKFIRLDTVERLAEAYSLDISEIFGRYYKSKAKLKR